MGVRFVPELTFHIDRSEKMKARIDDLLGRKRQRQATGNREQGTGNRRGTGNREQAAGNEEPRTPEGAAVRDKG
jgi:hypothetical protein